MVQAIREWTTFLADICILAITVYTFYITFISKKLKLLSFQQTVSNSGDSYSLVLENKSFAPVSIREISVIFDGNYKMRFNEYAQPIILGAFSAVSLSMEPFSFLAPHIPIEAQFNPIVCVDTSRKQLYLSLHKKARQPSAKIKSLPPNVSVMRCLYNDRIVMPGNRYVLHLFTSNETMAVFIDKHGIMSENVFGYNVLPREVMENENALIEVLDSLIKPHGIRYVLEDFVVEGNSPFGVQ